MTYKYISFRGGNMFFAVGTLAVFISAVLIALGRENLGSTLLVLGSLVLFVDSISTIKKNKKLGWDAQHSLGQLSAQVVLFFSSIVLAAAVVVGLSVLL